MRFRTIVTHVAPHLDEIVAVWLLQKFGESKFPGMKSVELDFWSTGGETPDNRSAVDYEKEGILLVGVGGGRFDKHPVNGVKKEGECAATLVAKELGIAEDPSFGQILDFVKNSDLKGGGNPFDLANLVKTLHSQFPDDPEKVIEWAMLGIEAKYQEQVSFLTSVKEEFDRLAEVEEIQGPNGRSLRMVTIESDNTQMSQLARSVHGGYSAVIIQKQSSGNVQIFTNKYYGLTLYDIVQMIRLAEQQAKGRAVTSDWKTLSSEGKVEGAEEWYFHQTGQMLLNGSLTARNVPPTRLSLDQIKEIVRIGINPELFEPSYSEHCKTGNCLATRSNPCPWYQYGLKRCRTIRFHKYNAMEPF